MFTMITNIWKLKLGIFFALLWGSMENGVSTKRLVSFGSGLDFGHSLKSGFFPEHKMRLMW